ncbi:MAG: TetR/AcrR family transcriptional regulator [Alphaproteobacteria bacterium]|uniref:TetR/AcrR family transcriptional regulator n=1 Tax=Brevundimonas sp. TaxID=1871086 RepID=UPI000DB0BA61|nr:TetR/AcrR family transcriptional regulator [Alphaproteobacteria bacterium]MBU1520386.1 TetR/AcrR family transcriptional regulator [Alphaproteobacteria bacterium]MBU2029828.1 TetR/AcrR family transcriptional regulator [Alphaproteobacteria bacterium]MBU2164654.1 TetR/AcrR family transcriptional regulator [Alphaproteobacteria bacterium]MBU2231445.1 TetR/AcrR family transcriptional regulator [Alphaproteobacteria bacterium]
MPEFITERPSSLDGRRERSTRSRHAIARAMLDLMRETQSIPTVDAVADRANVSRRSVFRHFPETNSLIIAAVDMQRTDVSARFAPRDLSTLGLPERVRAVSQRLGRMNEYITPARSLVDQFRKDHPVIDDMLKEDERTYTHHLGLIFRDGLEHHSAEDRDLVLQAMVSAAGWATWRGLRKDQFLSVLGARKVVEYTLCALLTVRPS